MATLARDLMTLDPACCSTETTLEAIAKLMVENDCGEIPVLDRSDRPIGVVTDRDIVCRVVAKGYSTAISTAESCMTTPVQTVDVDAPLETILALMENCQIRRLPVVDEDGCCLGIISQADLA